MPETPVTWPSPFFGVATAAYQIEGAVSEDGRGESIWDRFSHTQGATANGDTGDAACDHYHRWVEDLDLMADLGIETYRFSISWPRVQPDGRGAVNAKGLAFYRRLAEGLRERGIEPVATLYHWDLPQALQDEGGWATRDTTERFAEYAAIAADELADVVAAWITHNKPNVVSFKGHADGVMAPGIRDWATALRVSHHLLLSHGLATRALRAALPPGTPVGITLNLHPAYPASDTPEDRAAATRADGHQNRWFLDPVLRARYPPDMIEHYARTLGPPDSVQDGDLETIAQPLDFLGVNYYFPERVAAEPLADPLGFERVAPRPPLTAMGWEQDASAFRDLLMRLARDYGDVPFWITENGAAMPDTVAGGKVDDPDRIAYLRDHLNAVTAARAGGVDIRRYFLWSLLDNFEWAHGFGPRFGIVRVDYETQERIPKASAAWYRDRIANARA
ncbi:MAG: GH1 family beta-glucosidase [Solirubrobacteraceae bacterium]